MIIEYKSFTYQVDKVVNVNVKSKKYKIGSQPKNNLLAKYEQLYEGGSLSDTVKNLFNAKKERVAKGGKIETIGVRKKDNSKIFTSIENKGEFEFPEIDSKNIGAFLEKMIILSGYKYSAKLFHRYKKEGKFTLNVNIHLKINSIADYQINAIPIVAIFEDKADYEYTFLFCGNFCRKVIRQIKNNMPLPEAIV